MPPEASASFATFLLSIVAVALALLLWHLRRQIWRRCCMRRTASDMPSELLPLPRRSFSRGQLTDREASEFESFSARSLDSFYSCYGDDLERALAPSRPSRHSLSAGGPSPSASAPVSVITSSASSSALPRVPSLPRVSSGCNATSASASATLLRPPQQQRQNANQNQVSQYRWLEGLLRSVVDGSARGRCRDLASMREGTPLFVVAGSCPNSFCGMQALVFCRLSGGGRQDEVDFWWVKPKVLDQSKLEPSTLDRHATGEFKNVAEKARKLYAPFAEKFSKGLDGDFWFGFDDSGRAVIRETLPDGQCLHMLLYFVWQEAWSSVFSRQKFIEGQLYYERAITADATAAPRWDPASGAAAAPVRFFARHYRLEDSRLWIAPFENEEALEALLPSDDGIADNQAGGRAA
eukprot:TRINITY_DN26806_c0_g1_i2.p1 TRINITY_DN26806_c0_g1~~TRINITY_DN26806_c0_g1_i2.p1  ORF type:complete len:408 (+),score=81.20 TRINITY_DN26806_c0_g1_i2:92-1315(+)